MLLNKPLRPILGSGASHRPSAGCMATSARQTSKGFYAQ